MAKHIETGYNGEEQATKFLEEQGYSICHRNWRHRRAEVDIIAKSQEILVFVEVKTRSYDFFGKPENFVTHKKKILLFDAARAYMEQHNYEGEIRFDIISIIWNKGKLKSLNHFEDVFFPGLEFT